MREMLEKVLSEEDRAREKVRAAREQASEIIRKAEHEASRIVEDARKDAQKLVREGHEKAEAEADQAYREEIDRIRSSNDRFQKRVSTSLEATIGKVIDFLVTPVYDQEG